MFAIFRGPVCKVPSSEVAILYISLLLSLAIRLLKTWKAIFNFIDFPIRLIICFSYLKCDGEYPLVDVASYVTSMADFYRRRFITWDFDTRETVNHLVTKKQ